MSKSKAKIELNLRLNGYIKCPLCKNINKLTLWDASTHDQCDTREKRRAYISLEEIKAYGRRSGLVFMCPSCTNYVDGFKLKPFIEENGKSK